MWSDEEEEKSPFGCACELASQTHTRARTQNGPPGSDFRQAENGPLFNPGREPGTPFVGRYQSTILVSTHVRPRSLSLALDSTSCSQRAQQAAVVYESFHPPSHKRCAVSLSLCSFRRI